MRVWAVLVAIVLAACARRPTVPKDDSLFTLYRNSVTDAAMRLHVVTFDTKDGETYNHENCELARQVFQSQDGVKTHFWCEQGHAH